MTNYEVYINKIIEKHYFASKNGKLMSCNDITCDECDFLNNYEECYITLLRWLTQEYQESDPTLTKSQKGLCEAFGCGWLARNNNTYLWYYSLKPEKDIEQNKWICFHGICIWLDIRVLPDFPFIKWEDEEPHSIKEMLTWEIQDE